MSELPIFLVLSRFSNLFRWAMWKRQTVGFLSGRGGLFLGFCVCGECESWVTHLTPVPLKFPAQLSLCRWGEQLQWGQSFACCLQDMKSALWTVTIVWGGQTLFTAGLWPFILSVLSFSHSCGELGQFVVDLRLLQALYENVSNRRLSVWECDTHSSCQCPHLGSLPPRVLWRSLIRGHWIYISLD